MLESDFTSILVMANRPLLTGEDTGVTFNGVIELGVAVAGVTLVDVSEKKITIIIIEIM